MPRQETKRKTEGRCETVHSGGGNWNVEVSVEKGIILICFVLGCNLKNDRMISVRFQGKPFNVTVIQAYDPTSNAEDMKLNGSMKTYKTF